MKKQLLTIVSLLMCVVAFLPINAQQLQMIPADKGQVVQQLPQFKKQLQRHDAMSRVQRTNAGSWAYYEDFEESLVNNPTYGMPEGWVNIATPGDDSDTWKSGGLIDYSTNTNLKGPDGGMGMAVLIGNSNHDQDAWAITPMFTLEAGKEYRIRYYVRFYSGNGNERIKAWLGTEQTVEGMTTLLYEDTVADQWARRDYTFTPEVTGEYCLGFEGLSSKGAVDILIDYISVVCGPVFYGEETIAFPATTTLEASQQKAYYINNIGTEDLEVSLNDATSPEITVEGLPVTIQGNTWSSSKITVTLDVKTAGEYEGQLVLNTNNPGQETIVIPVTETVTESYVTGRWFENFTKGQPKGWTLKNGYFTANNGIDGSMSLYGTSMAGSMQYTTRFTDLGSNPQLSFYYHPQATDASSNPITTTSDIVQMYVQVSTNGGMTWDTVYTVSPTVNPYTVTDEFTRVDVDLSQYANQTALVRFDIPEYFNFSWTTFNYTILDMTLDNIELGTKSSNDMSVKYLYGETNLRAGEPATLTAMVRNSGTTTASGYTVRLVGEDGAVLASAQGKDLEPEEMTAVDLQWTPSKVEMTSVYAQVELSGDADDTYNKTDLVAIAVAPATASDIVAGNLATSNLVNEPLMLYNKESASQSLYLANDLNLTRGVVYGIKYHVFSPNEYFPETVQMWVGETSKEDYSDAQFVDVNTLTKVYEGRPYLPGSESGEVTIAFDKPVEYNGGNLVVYVYRTASYFVMNRYTYGDTATTAQRSITISTDATGTITPTDPMAAGVDANCYDYYPVAEFLIDVPNTGAITGKVVDEQGNPIQGATVSINGTQLTAQTDAEGNYTFDAIAWGEYELVAVAQGYQDATVTVTVDADEVAQDIVMTAHATYTVKGVVTDAQTHEAVSGALVRLIGYDNYIAATDANGNYEIAGVYGVADSLYNVAVTASYYKDLTTPTILVTGDMTADYALTEQNFPVHNATATTDANSATVSWEAPLPEYRHDSGIPNGSQRGFVPSMVDYPATAVLGATYRHAATIRDVEWYLTDDSGPHDNVNIIIFALDEQGEPGYDILYKESVSSEDLKWNIHSLTTPVEAPNGFCVSMSYSNGFLALSESNPTAEYPTISRAYYYNNNYTYDDTDDKGNRLVNWHDCTTFMDNALMLRAVGDDYGKLDNEYLAAAIEGSDAAMEQSRALVDVLDPVSYTIYRLVPGQEQDEWDMIADGVTSLNYTDSEFAMLAEGDYQYAIVANYLNGSSDYRMTDIVYSESSAVIETLQDTDVLTNGNVYTVDGRLVSTSGIKGLDAGIYICNGRKIAIK